MELSFNEQRKDTKIMSPISHIPLIFTLQTFSCHSPNLLYRPIPLHFHKSPNTIPFSLSHSTKKRNSFNNPLKQASDKLLHLFLEKRPNPLKHFQKPKLPKNSFSENVKYPSTFSSINCSKKKLQDRKKRGEREREGEERGTVFSVSPINLITYSLVGISRSSFASPSAVLVPSSLSSKMEIMQISISNQSLCLSCFLFFY